MVTNLHDTKYFSRVRISFGEIATVGEMYAGNNRLPAQAFRRELGFFYIFQELRQSLVPYLDLRPLSPRESELFVWTLKEEGVSFGAIAKDYDGREKRVPWWVIKPLLRWQQSGGHSSVISAVGTVFFIEAHPTEYERKPIGVSLSLDCGSLHSEWHLRPFSVEMKTRFPAGSVFLSVA